MPEDDPVGIPNGTRLFRRADPTFKTYDSNRKQWRPTSQVFQDSNDGTPMSVFAENVAIEHGETPQGFLQGRWAEWYLVAVFSEDMRTHGQKVYLDPHNQDLNDSYHSHAAVEGRKDPKTRKKLSQRYEWVIPPPDLFDPPE